MSIFNGDSIYNNGGGSGGGAYSDGGALVDGDLIQVTNNTISTYENTSRNEINYYFEVEENEVINAVIELTNQVNATINVYVLNNGIYTPLGNVGGNTVNAGEEYNVNITGDSFSISQVAKPSTFYINAFGILTPAVKIGNKYWTSENLYSQFAGLTVGGPYQITSPGAWWYNNDSSTYGHNGTKYNLYYNVAAAKYIDQNIGGGWRVATKTDFSDLFAFIGNNLSKIFSNGTNETNLSFVLCGNYVDTNSWNQVGMGTSIRCHDVQNNTFGPFYSGDKNNMYFNSFIEDAGRGCSIRLVKDA